MSIRRQHFNKAKAKVSPAGANPPIEAEGNSVEAGAVVTITGAEGLAGVLQVPLPSGDFQVGAHLAHFQSKWTFSSWAHSIVANGRGWAWREHPPPLRTFYQKETPFLKEYIQELLTKES